MSNLDDDQFRKEQRALMAFIEQYFMENREKDPLDPQVIAEVCQKCVEESKKHSGHYYANFAADPHSGYIACLTGLYRDAARYVFDGRVMLAEREAKPLLEELLKKALQPVS